MLGFFSRRNAHWTAIYNKHGVEVEILFDNLTEKEAFLEEISVIAELKYFGYKLANKTNGGEGTSGYKPWNKGESRNVETRLRVSAGLKRYYENNISARKGVECFKLWTNPKANKEIWANAGLVHSYWTMGAGPKQLARIFTDFGSGAFVKLTEAFKTGFVPSENDEWLAEFKGPKPILKENPFALLRKVQKFDVYLKSEEIYRMYKEGKRAKAISRLIGCNCSNVQGILLKFENGWNPNDDEVFSFIKMRASVEKLDE